MARDCTSRSREKSNSCEEEKVAQVASEERLLMVKLDESQPKIEVQQEQKTTYAEVVKQRSGQRKEQQWIVDSGASHHMTSDASTMQCYKGFDQMRKVQLGDGKWLLVIGCSQIKMKVKHGWRSMTSVQVSNVLLVPGLVDNLLSVKAIVDKVKRVSFDRNSCWIGDNDGATITVGWRQAGLFMLNMHDQEESTTYHRDGDGWSSHFMKK